MAGTTLTHEKIIKVEVAHVAMGTTAVETRFGTASTKLSATTVTDAMRTEKLIVDNERASRLFDDPMSNLDT